VGKTLTTTGRLGRLRLGGPPGTQEEFVFAAIAQNLRRFAALVAGHHLLKYRELRQSLRSQRLSLLQRIFATKS
jgi:hypothetical protein